MHRRLAGRRGECTLYCALRAIEQCRRARIPTVGVLRPRARRVARRLRSTEAGPCEEEVRSRVTRIALESNVPGSCCGNTFAAPLLRDPEVGPRHRIVTIACELLESLACGLDGTRVELGARPQRRQVGIGWTIHRFAARTEQQPE